LWQNQPSLTKTVIVAKYNIEAFLAEASTMIKDGLRESNKMEIRSKTELQKTLDHAENQYKKTITPEDADFWRSRVELLKAQLGGMTIC